MSLAAGIIGLPNVGKSTIFNALSSGKAESANYPFCTIDPNHGVVAVPDSRLARITTCIPTDKVVPAFLELVDIAGLVKGASKGEGLGNQFLGHIKDVNAVIHVVRCFKNDDIVHVEGSIDPQRDISIIDTELILADLGTVERSVTRVEKAAKSGDKEAIQKVAVFKKANDALSQGIPIRKAITDPDEQKLLNELHLITSKPVLYVANVDEDGVATDNDAVKTVRKIAADENAECIKICGKLEEEIAQLSQEERDVFLAELGYEEPGLAVLSRAAYNLLGLETYFTAGKTENRAWTIKKGFKAPQAAGVIHTDFEKGFIKADVYSLEDLETYKTEVALRAAGKIRSEGREYVVQDGDIMFFKFNV
ncbi:MAG: redox-regulated ATPase YchF [Chitinispirillaceae bacterium]|nr:redox-regulated ATPase YchF [Chitinispirillaceae bacterium]